MRYAKIKFNNTANGEGIRTALFVQGCTIVCPGCQNYEIQTFKGGKEFGVSDLYSIFNSMHNGIAGLSILGGEPLSPPNIETVIDIIKLFKEEFPNKTVWLWTGYRLDLSLKNKEYTGHRFEQNPSFYREEILNLVDVLVDGRWEQDNYDPKLLWAGSTNQRVINVKETVKLNDIVLLPNFQE